MIDWGNTPAGSLARIYLPTVSVDEIIKLFAKRYSLEKVRHVDDHTFEFSVHRLSYISIPPGPNLNHVGLLTIDLPPGVRKRQLFKIVVRQITHAAPIIFLKRQPKIRNEDASHAQSNFDWRQVLGTFQISIPVQSKEEMLEPEERLLSVLRWILQSIPAQDRWYLAIPGVRYKSEINLGKGFKYQ